MQFAESSDSPHLTPEMRNLSPLHQVVLASFADQIHSWNRGEPGNDITKYNPRLQGQSMRELKEWLTSFTGFDQMRDDKDIEKHILMSAIPLNYEGKAEDECVYYVAVPGLPGMVRFPIVLKEKDEEKICTAVACGSNRPLWGKLTSDMENPDEDNPERVFTNVIEHK